MKKKALIFDVDGTIMPSGSAFEYMPSERLKRAVQQLSKYYYIAPATGRIKEHALHIAEFLELDGVAIVGGGTEIVDLKNRETVWIEPLPTQTYDLLRNVLGQTTSARITSNTALASRIEDADLGLHLDDTTTVVFATGLDHELANAMVQSLAHDDLKIISMHHYKDPLSAKKDIHIHSIRASKEHALRALLEREGIEPANVTVFGDGINDLELFKVGGTRVAMGNAAPELKAAADMVIGDVADDGLAAYFEKLIEEINENQSNNI